MPLNYNNETCSGCKACQLICALYNFSESNPSKALLNIFGKFPAPGKYYAELCTQCGACADVCPVDAICNEDGIYTISAEDCVSCGICVDACPQKVIRLIDNLPHKCTECGECATICPRDAIIFSKEGVSV
jgi:Fe-S-cluster-containing hydrogenase component 2